MGTWYAIGLLATVLVTSFASVGLLSLWAATSPRHWLLRSAAVLAVLLPLPQVSAHEPWAVFVLQACVIVLGVKIWQWLGGLRRDEGKASDDGAAERGGFSVRFSLRTLMAFTALVAVLTASAIPLVKDRPELAGSWTAIAVSGICGGCAVLMVAWMRAAKRKWTAWLTTLLVCLGLASLAARFDLLFTSTGYAIDYESKIPPAAVWLAVIPASMGCTWLLLGAWSASTRRRDIQQTVAPWIFGLLLAVTVGPPAFVVWNLADRLPVPHIPVPQPNGIDDIVAAGNAFGTSPILCTAVEPTSTEELAAEVTKYAADYDRLRLGLSREVRAHIWVKKGKVVQFDLNSSTTIQAVRQAAQALMREAELAQQQNRYADAARISLENMQLGQAVCRDGLLVDVLIGIVVEGMGHQSLYQVLAEQNGDECREIIAALIEIDRHREPIAAVLRRERIWSERAYGWLGHLYFEFVETDTDETHDHMRFLHVRNAATTRLFIAELALQAYQLEHGALPGRLEELTPEFLTELPLDPFDPVNRPLRYVRTDDGYVVYSIGADGKDDGGRAPPRNEYGGYDVSGNGDLPLGVLFPPDDDTGEGDTDSSE